MFVSDLRQGCVQNNGGCSHFCTPASDGRKCSCNAGYKLDFDEESCSGKNVIYRYKEVLK